MHLAAGRGSDVVGSQPVPMFLLHGFAALEALRRSTVVVFGAHWSAAVGSIGEWLLEFRTSQRYSLDATCRAIAVDSHFHGDHNIGWLTDDSHFLADHCISIA